MSEGNVELVRRVYRAVNEGDRPAFVALMHPEVELTTSGVYPDFHTAYQGVADYWDAAREVWDAFSIEIGRCEPVGDEVLVQVRQQVEGRNGIIVEHDWGHLFSFADGLIRRVRAYPSWDAATRAVGLHSEAQQG